MILIEYYFFLVLCNTFLVSDTCYAGVNEDRSGPELEKSVLSAFPQAKIPAKCIVPDCQSTIADVLIKWSSPPHDCNVILTTGGTGFAPRDVTPEATRGVIQKVKINSQNSCLLIKYVHNHTSNLYPVNHLFLFII